MKFNRPHALIQNYINEVWRSAAMKMRTNDPPKLLRDENSFTD
ncbi:Hypothetical protein BIBO2_1744 [Brucella sp. BO2]|nr:Hypothetical protein BIBO2_1744 [Brucella sp. BO2]